MDYRSNPSAWWYAAPVGVLLGGAAFWYFRRMKAQAAMGEDGLDSAASKAEIKALRQECKALGGAYKWNKSAKTCDSTRPTHRVTINIKDKLAAEAKGGMCYPEGSASCQLKQRQAILMLAKMGYRVA